MRTDVMDAYQDLLCWWSADAGRGVELRLRPGGQLEYGEHDGQTWSSAIGSGVALADGAWHMVAVVRWETGEAAIYADGAQVGIGHLPAKIPEGLLEGAMSARVIHRHYDHVLEGEISFAVIYSSALSHTQILGVAGDEDPCQDPRDLHVMSATQSGPRASGPTAAPDWDVAFTVYDPDLVPPWAEGAAQVGRTSAGFTRINAGVVLLSLASLERACRFLTRWAHAGAWLAFQGKEPSEAEIAGPAEAELRRLTSFDGMRPLQWQEWHAVLIDEFRSANQAALALLASSYDVGRLRALLSWGESCEMCAATSKAELELLPASPPFTVRFRALPCSKLNHPESMPGGAFSEELLAVHLKGFWWRAVLPWGLHSAVDPHRKSDWNRDSLLLYLQLWETWQFSVPEAAKVQGVPQARNDDGSKVELDRDMLQAFLQSERP